MANILLKDEEIATFLLAALPNIYRFYGSVAAYGRNGGICKDQFTANSPGNLPVKSFVNRL